MIFWNEVFIIAGNESLWLVQKLTGLPHQVDGIRSFVNLNWTDYNMIIRKTYGGQHSCFSKVESF